MTKILIDEATVKQVLEALEKVIARTVIMGSTGDYREGQLDALSAVTQDVAPFITAIKEALAQPAQQQEPVATKLESQRFNGFPVSAADFEKLKALPVGTKLYTAPQVQSAQRTVGDAQEWDDRHGTGGSYGIGGCYGPAAFTDGGLDGY